MFFDYNIYYFQLSKKKMRIELTEVSVKSFSVSKMPSTRSIPKNYLVAENSQSLSFYWHQAIKTTNPMS